ncbi:enoyl-CoA isomerase, partial [Danaus plexippus plexippus]|jgi:hypothetical protein
MSLK